jgi:hypothetical protein
MIRDFSNANTNSREEDNIIGKFPKLKLLTESEM